MAGPLAPNSFFLSPFHYFIIPFARVKHVACEERERALFAVHLLISSWSFSLLYLLTLLDIS